jgi:hypothetical protein
MPFIEQWRRNVIDEQGLKGLPEINNSEIQPGDRCYVYYRYMVYRWRDEPRWSTAHILYRELLDTFHPSDDEEAAHHLAWQVFFQLHVLPYERSKQQQNGDI